MASEPRPNTPFNDDSLPPDVRTFLSNVVHGSLMRYDVLRFFYQNPYAILTTADLTIWMSLEERPLTETLQQLTNLGFLSQSRASAAFILDPDRERRRKLDAFFDFLEDHPDVARQLRDALRRRLEMKHDGN